MSSKNKKGNKLVVVQFEEILKLVQDFSYDADSSVKKDESKPAGSSKPKTLDAIRKESLSKLFSQVVKIKGAVFADKQSQKVDVENLYKLLAEKLGADLYKFDISFCVKFLAGYSSKLENKTDYSVRILLDCMLRNAIEQLNSWQVAVAPFEVSEMKEGKEADFGAVIKSMLVAEVKDKCLCKEPKATREHFVATVYLALMLSNRNRFGFGKYIAVLERAIAEYIADFEPKDLSKNYVKAIPEALIDTNPKSKVRNSVFLYFGVMDIMTNISKENERLAAELSGCRLRISELTLFVKNLTEAGEQKDGIIADSEKKINELKEQLTASSDRLEFEVNMFEKQLASVKAGIYERVRRDLQLELDGIGNISKRLSNKEADELSRWIANIKQIVDTVGGKK